MHFKMSFVVNITRIYSFSINESEQFVKCIF